jgi:hypothetical protein
MLLRWRIGTEWKPQEECLLRILPPPERGRLDDCITWRIDFAPTAYDTDVWRVCEIELTYDQMQELALRLLHATGEFNNPIATNGKGE